MLRSTLLSFLLTSTAIVPGVSICQAGENTTEDHELQSLDFELQQLQQDLDLYRTQALNDEMRAQPYMFDHWDRYADYIGENEEDAKNILNLQRRMQTLSDRRQLLMERNTH